MARHKRNICKSDFSPVFRHFVNVLINRVVVDNLPEEIDSKFLLYHVLLYGRVLFFKSNGKYHVMWFSGKGHLNEYYIQKDFLIVNPWAKETNGDYEENKTACILYSDINAYIENADVGLYDIVEEYSEIINQIDKSIKALAKNSKVIAFLTGSTTSFVHSAKQVINRLLDSDECIGVMEESLVDNIKVNPISEKMDYKFSELIKARQYYISDFYQKIGISANMNMKAERLTDNESQLIDSVSDIDFEHIIDNLNFSVEKINSLFGLNISFRLNENEQVVDNTNDMEDEENEQDTGTNDVRDDREGTQTPDGEPSVSGTERLSDSSLERSTGTEDNNVDPEIQGNTDTDTEENNEEVNNGVNVEINIDTETAEVSSEEVVDNKEDEEESDEDVSSTKRTDT
ncbi:MAG: hypothetical protein J6R32_11520 [Bacteroidales bacterium]|nr:hypothetical protein [Bacteroidales bacterium]